MEIVPLSRITENLDKKLKYKIYRNVDGKKLNSWMSG